MTLRHSWKAAIGVAHEVATVVEPVEGAGTCGPNTASAALWPIAFPLPKAIPSVNDEPKLPAAGRLCTGAGGGGGGAGEAGLGGFFSGLSAVGLLEARRGDERDLDHGNQLPAEEDMSPLSYQHFLVIVYRNT